jgi:hypothetical protein
MSAENVAIARRWYQEVWNDKNPKSIYELMHPSALAHSSLGPIRGPENWKTLFWDVFHGAFSDIRLTVEDAADAGQNVMVRWRATMKHTGPALGIPISHKVVEIFGLSWVVIRDGQIVEGWDGWDSTGLMKQCGAA